MIQSYSSNSTLYKLVRNRNPENSAAGPDPPPKPPSYSSNVDIIISYDWLIECCITHLQKKKWTKPLQWELFLSVVQYSTTALLMLLLCCRCFVFYVLPILLLCKKSLNQLDCPSRNATIQVALSLCGRTALLVATSRAISPARIPRIANFITC